MSFKGSSAWKAEAFMGERDHFYALSRLRADAFPRADYVKRHDGWIIFGPLDVRNGRPQYRFALQYLKCDRTLRVRVGCRYYTLKQAWNRWHPTRGGVSTYRRNECKQAIAIIQLMLAQAQAYSLLSMWKPIIFDNSLRKKRK